MRRHYFKPGAHYITVENRRAATEARNTETTKGDRTMRGMGSTGADRTRAAAPHGSKTAATQARLTGLQLPHWFTFRSLVLIVAMVLVAALAAAPVSGALAADSVLDQEQTVIGDGYMSTHATRSTAQTLTAGMTGGLDRVSLYLSKYGSPGDLTVGIYGTRISFGTGNSYPTGSALATAVLSEGDVDSSYQWVDVSFTSPPQVTSGTQYAIVLSISSSADSSSGYNSPPAWDAYAGGRVVFNDGSGWFFVSAFYDYPFKTYVVPQSSPAITTEPTDKTVIAGSNATFTAVASGDPYPAIQWQVSTDGGASYSNILVATNATYTFISSSADDGNKYRAVFTNSLGSATSRAATLTVLHAPSITTQPQDVTLTDGQVASFTAAAGGNPVPTVQWQVSANGGSTWTNIGGATDPTLSFTAVAGSNGHKYRAVFTNSMGNTASRAATLTVHYAPSVTSSPQDQTVTSGNTATFTAGAGGNPAPSVQWQRNTGPGWENISGATSTTLTLSSVSVAMDGNQYRAVFTNSVGSATSDAATLTVHFAPSVTSQPQDETVNDSDTATFTAAASGNPTPTVQWQVNTGSGWSNISGATSATYSFFAQATDDGNQYLAVFTNSVGSATSNAATLHVNQPTVTTLGSSANPSVYGQAVRFTATVVKESGSGTPTGSVQFKVDGSDFGGPVTLDSNGEVQSDSISSLSVGGHTVGADYTPTSTSNYKASGGTLSGGQTVNRADTATSLAAVASPQTYGQSITFTATVSAVAAGSGTPTGTVTFFDGSTNLGTRALSGGQATLSTSSLGVGSHTITTAYSGDTNFKASSSSGRTFTVQAATTTLYNGGQMVIIGNTLKLSAAVTSAASYCTSNGTVSFTLDRNPTTGAVGTYTVAGVAVSSGAASRSLSTTGWLEGVYTLRASYSGPTGCVGSYDEATLTVGSAGDAANGGGWTTVSGLGRLNFGFTIKKVPNTSPAQYKGQFVMINNGKWRLKGVLDSYTKTSTRQGAVGGTGDLYSWDSTLNGGLGGWALYQAGVTFTASFTDNGTNLKTNPDKYGQHIDVSGAPNFAPTSIKGGDLRVN